MKGKRKAFGGRNRGRGLKRRGRDRYESDFLPVIAFVEKRMRVSKDMKGKKLKFLVRMGVKEGSLLFTDDYPSYKVLEGDYERRSINHSKGEYEKGEVHVSSFEGEFPVFRILLSVHRRVAKNNLGLYVASYELHR
ncbi:MAG: transposase [Armatimonadota bacterium]|nr:transposase [Armatimonadota bacterium]MDW8026280.1 transposase [Armatimonadota bacterium]